MYLLYTLLKLGIESSRWLSVTCYYRNNKVTSDARQSIYSTTDNSTLIFARPACTKRLRGRKFVCGCLDNGKYPQYSTPQYMEMSCELFLLIIICLRSIYHHLFLPSNISFIRIITSDIPAYITSDITAYLL